MTRSSDMYEQNGAIEWNIERDDPVVDQLVGVGARRVWYHFINV